MLHIGCTWDHESTAPQVVSVNYIFFYFIILLIQGFHAGFENVAQRVMYICPFCSKAFNYFGMILYTLHAGTAVREHLVGNTTVFSTPLAC